MLFLATLLFLLVGVTPLTAPSVTEITGEYSAINSTLLTAGKEEKQESSSTQPDTSLNDPKNVAEMASSSSLETTTTSSTVQKLSSTDYSSSISDSTISITTTNSSTDFTSSTISDHSSDLTDSSTDFTVSTITDNSTDSTIIDSSTYSFITDSSTDFTVSTITDNSTDSTITDSSTDFTGSTITDSSTDSTITDNLTEFTTTEPSTSTDSTTDNTTFPEISTDVSTTSEGTYSSTTSVITTTDEYTTNIITSTDEYTTDIITSTDESTTDITTPDSGNNSSDAGLLLGILIPVLVIGVTVILWMSYRSGKLVWPPKSFNFQNNDTRPSYIPLKKFPTHCDKMLEIPSRLSREYELLATQSSEIINSESFIAAQHPENKVKNRYINILPYDSTRVKLIPEDNDFCSDYINASYIKGYTNEIEYIATQGPKQETCHDFWRMVYQESIKVIVMVTQLEEMGKPKCYKYFPNLRENMTFNDLSVWCTSELHFPIYSMRTLVLTKDDRKRSITHLHFREWPDFGCPTSPDLMLQFCQVMRQYMIMVEPGITLVHCSAGVGRTGTLIAVDILIQQINQNKKINIFDTVYKLRRHRLNMVQSEAQYVYIYKCVKEALLNPSYLCSENSSTSSTEPIYENVECSRISPSNKIPTDAVIIAECEL